MRTIARAATIACIAAVGMYSVGNAIAQEPAEEDTNLSWLVAGAADRPIDDEIIVEDGKASLKLTFPLKLDTKTELLGDHLGRYSGNSHWARIYWADGTSNVNIADSGKFEGVGNAEYDGRFDFMAGWKDIEFPDGGSTGGEYEAKVPDRICLDASVYSVKNNPFETVKGEKQFCWSYDSQMIGKVQDGRGVLRMKSALSPIADTQLPDQPTRISDIHGCRFGDIEFEGKRYANSWMFAVNGESVPGAVSITETMKSRTSIPVTPSIFYSEEPDVEWSARESDGVYSSYDSVSAPPGSVIAGQWSEPSWQRIGDIDEDGKAIFEATRTRSLSLPNGIENGGSAQIFDDVRMTGFDVSRATDTNPDQAPCTDKPGTDKPGTDKPGTDKPGTVQGSIPDAGNPLPGQAPRRNITSIPSGASTLSVGMDRNIRA